MTQTFKEAFYFFRHNLVKLLSYTLSIGILVVVLPQLLNTLFFGDVIVEEGAQETIQPFVQVVNLLIQPIYSGGLIVLIFGLASNQVTGIFECVLAGIMRWPSMFLANIMTTLMVIAGLLLFLLPGIWLFTRLFLVPFLVMLNNQTPIEAIKNSFQYTQGYSLTILNDIVFLIVIFTLSILVLNFLQILYPILMLFFLLLFQTMANVVYYRHYEILLKRNTSENALQ